MSELVKALVKARMACKAVIRKEGKNSAQGYAYVGHEHVLTSGAREALLSNGLTLVQTSVSFTGELEVPKDGNRVMKVWRWTGVFHLSHESGEQTRYDFEATTQANDKAAFVASTALDRTALLRICQMSGGAKEDPEHDSNDRYEGAAEKTRRVERTLDSIANEGGPASEQRESPTAATTTTAKDAGPAAATSATPLSEPRTPPSTASGATSASDGELLDAKAWRARLELLAEELMAGAAWIFEKEDEFGLPIPPCACPTFSQEAQRFAGKRYDDKAVVGFLRKVAQRPDFTEKSADKRAWALYSVARHEAAKERSGG